MEELFGRGIIVIDSSRDDPSRQVGIFNMELVKQFPCSACRN
jgi:hypothetical protein